jgi:hypothetical protein
MVKGQNGKNCVGCTPAVIYSMLAGAGILLSVIQEPRMLSTPSGLIHLAIQIFAAVFWTYVMYWLCSMCYKGAAWALLLIPLIAGLIMVYFIIVKGNGTLVAFY